jgi:hypothetical protein
MCSALIFIFYIRKRTREVAWLGGDDRQGEGGGWEWGGGGL